MYTIHWLKLFNYDCGGDFQYVGGGGIDVDNNDYGNYGGNGGDIDCDNV